MKALKLHNFLHYYNIMPNFWKEFEPELSPSNYKRAIITNSNFNKGVTILVYFSEKGRYLRYVLNILKPMHPFLGKTTKILITL